MDVLVVVLMLVLILILMFVVALLIARSMKIISGISDDEYRREQLEEVFDPVGRCIYCLEFHRVSHVCFAKQQDIRITKKENNHWKYVAEDDVDVNIISIAINFDGSISTVVIPAGRFHASSEVKGD